MGNSKTRKLWGLTLTRGILLAFGLLYVIGALTLKAQDPKELLFQEANQQMEEAKSLEAHIFSPKNFEEATKNYQHAEDDYNKGKNLEDIRNRLKMASVYFMKSVEASKLAQENFKDCIKARNDALNAEANIYRREAWAEAEDLLVDASRTLEGGNLKSAIKKAGEVEQQYRTVELESIKANYLDETKNLIEQGEKSNIRKKAPLTLTKANELVKKAEKLLEESRYDTDEARQIAREAKYEALHAQYLAKTVEEIEKDKTKTLEAVLLDSENPIQTISEQFNLDARFNQGPKQPTDTLVYEIQMQQQMISVLQQDLKDTEEQLSRLQSQLGDAQTQKETLSKLMEQQKEFREKYNKIEKSFTKEEAEVIRVEDNVVIHIYGLNFPVGKSTIEPKYYGLLAKVVSAFDEFPGCVISVEGHTDSRGGDAANQKLSTERAKAVEEYLLATSGITESRITATGFGETKPTASNDTKEGRRKNRRIDVVIHPPK